MSKTWLIWVSGGYIHCQKAVPDSDYRPGWKARCPVGLRREDVISSFLGWRKDAPVGEIERLLMEFGIAS